MSFLGKWGYLGMDKLMCKTLGVAYLYYLGLRLICLKKNNTLPPKKVKKETKRDRSEFATEGDDLVCPILLGTPAR